MMKESMYNSLVSRAYWQQQTIFLNQISLGKENLVRFIRLFLHYINNVLHLILCIYKIHVDSLDCVDVSIKKILLICKENLVEGK